MATKKWYKSNTIHAGAITILIGAVEAYRQLVELGDFSVLAVLTSVIGVLTIVQRVLSKGGEISA